MLHYFPGEGERAGRWAFRVHCPGILKKDQSFLNGAAIGERVEFDFEFGVCFERLGESADCAEQAGRESYFSGCYRSVLMNQLIVRNEQAEKYHRISPVVLVLKGLVCWI